MIALQETHLTMELEFAFKAYAPSMDIFFAHGTSQSGGVLIALRHSINASGSVVMWLGKHGIVLDVQQACGYYRIINVYAPVEGDKRKQFLINLSAWVIPNATVILGDFNSIECHEDKSF